MPKLSRRPKTPDEFIKGAEIAAKKTTTKPTEEGVPKKKTYAKRFPWEKQGVRPDIIKGYNIRLPEPYLMKLRYIAKETPDSMQTFIVKVLFPAIDKKIEELTKHLKESK